MSKSDTLDYDNQHLLPEGIVKDQSPCSIYWCRSTHHDDDSFPVVAPDYKYDTFSNSYKQNSDPDGYRTEYLADIRKQMDGPKNTFKKSKKHYVPGYYYKNVADRFFVLDIPVAQIKNNNIVRLRVDIRDKHQNVRTHSYIDVAHLVLGIVSRNHQQGLGKILKQNAKLLQIEDNDCRPGQNMGEMAVQGYRSYANSIEMYKTTTGLFSKLEKSAGTFLSTYGFIKWVNNLRKNLVNNNGNRKSLGGTQDTSPWVTMSVSTVDYCNEDHLDGLDACQGITIWHESNPPRRNQPPDTNLTNWYFCFPNMEICIAESWVKGGSSAFVAWNSDNLGCTFDLSLYSIS